MWEAIFGNFEGELLSSKTRITFIEQVSSQAGIIICRLDCCSLSCLLFTFMSGVCCLVFLNNVSLLLSVIFFKLIEPVHNNADLTNVCMYCIYVCILIQLSPIHIHILYRTHTSYVHEILSIKKSKVICPLTAAAIAIKG